MGRLDPFWDVMCQYREFLWLGVMVLLFLFILTLFSLLLAPSGSASQLVAAGNFVLIVATGVVMLVMYRICLGREKSSY